MNTSDFQTLIKSVKVGQKIDSVILNVAPFGLFLSLPVEDSKLAEGFIHISEISWENVENIADLYKVGDKVTGVVIGFDKESRRVNLSVKRLLADPFEKKLDEFTVDKKIKAKVVKIIATGVLLDLGDNITGMIKKEKIPVKITYKEGQEVDVTVRSEEH